MGTREPEIALRRKLIGLQLQAARLEAGLDVTTCATWLGVSPEDLDAWESGRTPVPFSALVRLARRLDLPLAAFEDGSPSSPPEASSLRQRIGSRLKRFREQAGLSLEALASQVGLSPDQLAAAEAGALDLDAAVLAAIAKDLGFSLEALVQPSTEEPSLEAELPPDLAKWLAVKEHQQLVRHLQVLLDQPVEALTSVGRLLLDVVLLATSQEQERRNEQEQ